MSDSKVDLKIRFVYYLVRGIEWLVYLILLCFVVFNLTIVELLLGDADVETGYISSLLAVIFMLYCWLGMLFKRKVIPWVFKVAASKLAEDLEEKCKR